MVPRRTLARLWPQPWRGLLELFDSLPKLRSRLNEEFLTTVLLPLSSTWEPLSLRKTQRIVLVTFSGAGAFHSSGPCSITDLCQASSETLIVEILVSTAHTWFLSSPKSLSIRMSVNKPTLEGIALELRQMIYSYAVLDKARSRDLAGQPQTSQASSYFYAAARLYAQSSTLCVSSIRKCISDPQRRFTP